MTIKLSRNVLDPFYQAFEQESEMSCSLSSLSSQGANANV